MVTINLFNMERRCGSLSDMEEWSDKNTQGRYNSWLGCVANEIYLDNQRERLGVEKYLQWIKEKEEVDLEHRENNRSERGRYEKQAEVLSNKYFKTGVESKLNTMIWLGNLNVYRKELNNIFSPERESKEEFVNVKKSLYRFIFKDKPKIIKFKD